MIVNYNHNRNFIVLTTVITIINYDGKTFIVQATAKSRLRLECLLGKNTLAFCSGESVSVKSIIDCNGPDMGEIVDLSQKMTQSGMERYKISVLMRRDQF
jgi:hypothetical protein